MVWNSSSDIGNLLATEEGRDKLGMAFPVTSSVEFGAGAAIPALVLRHYNLSDKVLITDQFEESTLKAMMMSASKFERGVEVKPHSWGDEASCREGERL